MTDPTDADGWRISTREREAAIEALCVHLAEGRLAMTEYEERAGAIAEALIRGELRPVFADLPPPTPPFLLMPASAQPPPAQRLPEKLLAALAGEGVLLMAEDLPGTITYRRYRAAGVNHWWRRETVNGTVAVTGRRLLVWAAGIRQIDVGFASPLRTAIGVSVEKPERLLLAYDAAAFDTARSGRVELRFRTERADTFAELWGSTG